MQGFIPKLEQFIIKTKEYIIKTVAEMLMQELPMLTEEKFALFQVTGNRLIYEQEYFAKRKFLTVFGVAAQWMKQEKLEKLGKCPRKAVLHKLEEVLLSICEEECWALPAHVNPADTNWRSTIDLFAAETAQSMADIVDVAGEDLSSQCVARVRENVYRRVLLPFFETPVNTFGWEQCHNNWNAVCNGNIGSAYLHSVKKGQELNPQYLERICENLLYYIGGLAEDGTCMEGLGYYFYGMTYMVNFANELYERTNGELDLLQGSWGNFVTGGEDKRWRIAEWWSKCFFSSGRTVSLSDGDSQDKYRMGLACVLADRFPAVHLPGVKQAMILEEAPCYRYLPFQLDLFSTMHYLEKLKQQVEDQRAVYPNHQAEPWQSRVTMLKAAQWCIGEAGLHAVGFACKGGHNGEPHNHNDVGSFLYVAGNDMFLADLGAGEYTRDYFGEGRYHILCNRSLGHNVPVIAGKEQLTGAVHACKKFKAAEDDEKVCVLMDLTDVYEAEQLKNFIREICFYKDSGALTVEDTFECIGEVAVTENLVTQFLPEIEGNSIILIGKEICHIQIAASNNKASTPLRVISMEHYNHQGEKEQVYLIQWEHLIKKYQKVRFQVGVL